MEGVDAKRGQPTEIIISLPLEDWEKLGPDHAIILSVILPEIAHKMAADAIHYGPAPHRRLGIKGQWADIWRKIGPLERALWDGVELTRESPRQILMDLIGHCLLTIRMIDSQEALEAAVEKAGQDTRDAACVERWPDCESGRYDPHCCRFPKSCSVEGDRNG